MNRFIRVLVVAGSLSMWCGCASILGKSSRSVSIESSPGPAEVTIVNHAGKEVFRGQTPATVKLKGGAGFFKGEDYTVTFEKPGYETKTGKIKRKLSGWYLGGNLLAGGIIGWLIVDPATGAMWTLDDLQTTLTPTLDNETSGQGVRIATLDEVPPELRSKMTRFDSDTGQ